VKLNLITDAVPVSAGLHACFDVLGIERRVRTLGKNAHTTLLPHTGNRVFVITTGDEPALRRFLMREYMDEGPELCDLLDVADECAL
jgi:hypothetical protein